MKLTQAQALDLSIFMLRTIAAGGSFGTFEYWGFVHDIEEAA